MRTALRIPCAISTLVLALAAACDDGIQPPDSAAAILGAWVGESYNGSPIPGPVWDLDQWDLDLGTDSTLRDLGAFNFEFMAAGCCSTTQQWGGGDPLTGGCSYQYIEAASIDTIRISGSFSDYVDGTVAGNTMTLRIEGAHLPMLAGPMNVLVLRRRP